MTGQPLYNILISGGQRRRKTKADFVGNVLTLDNMNYITKVNAVYADTNDVPHFLEIGLDFANLALTPPHFSFPVYRLGTGANGPDTNPRNILDFFQPISGGKFDLWFRRDAPYPGGTVFLPSGDIVIDVICYPDKISSAGDNG